MLGLKKRYNGNEIDSVSGESQIKTVASHTESNLLVTFGGRGAEEGDSFVKYKSRETFEKMQDRMSVTNCMEGFFFLFEKVIVTRQVKKFPALCVIRQLISKFSHCLLK